MRILQGSIALFILALLGLVLFLEYRHRSPGRVSQVHAHLEDSCATCHGDEQRSLAAACNDCHHEIHEQVQTATGLHGQLPRGETNDCGRCHEEHRGRDYPLVSDHTFALVGLESIDSYRHQGLSYRLVGRHMALGCERCHRHATKVVLQKGEKRFLGLGQDCVACHEDPHKGKLPDCASCHGQEQPFDQVALFQHDTRFPLVHSHAGLTCKQCHDSIEDARDRQTIRGCADCHESRHSKAFLAATQKAGCTACHRVQHESLRSADERQSHDLHGASGFDLVIPHHEVACTECHQGSTRFRFPPRKQNDCRACHEDPHGGQFQQDCLSCHERLSFQDHRFDRERHAQAGFELVGAHKKLACERCHPLQQGVRRFRGINRDCRGCHEDRHAGQFKNRACTACHHQVHFRPATFTVAMHQRIRFPLKGAHGAVACNRCHGNGTYRNTPTDCRSCHVDVHDGTFGKTGCAECHSAESFRLRKGQAFDHGRWTGFELAGGHGKAQCRSCHPLGKATHGGTRRMARASKRCADCHTDLHAGQFRGKDCSDCHSVKRGFDLTHFDHGRQSRFKLDEKHKALRCDQCHKRYRLAGGGTVVRYKPLGVRCNDCHGWERK